MIRQMWQQKRWYEWLIASIARHGRDVALIAALVMMPSLAKGDDFTDALNAQRQARGLDPVAYGPSLVGTAQNNNAWQRARGLGHYDLGGFAQVVSVACGDASGCLAAWSRSAAHAALIYAPNLTGAGYANDGYYATATLSMGQVVAQQAPPAPVKSTPQQTITPAKPTEGCRPSTGCSTGQSFAGCAGHTCRTNCRVVSVRQCGFRKRGCHLFHGCHLFKRRCAW